jgi:hypothetical protein
VSIPDGVWATIGDHADVAQLVERDLAKVEVAGSSPVVRSRKVVPPRSIRPGSCVLGRATKCWRLANARECSEVALETHIDAGRRLKSLPIEMMAVVRGP